MSGWNHRVVRRTYPSGTLLSIHEAFYDSEGRVWGITEDPVSPMVEESIGETTENLKEVLNWMLKACDQPVLDYDKIPEEGANGPSMDFDEDDLEPWP